MPYTNSVLTKCLFIFFILIYQEILFEYLISPLPFILSVKLVVLRADWIFISFLGLALYLIKPLNLKRFLWVLTLFFVLLIGGRYAFWRETSHLLHMSDVLILIQSPEDVSSVLFNSSKRFLRYIPFLLIILAVQYWIAKKIIQLFPGRLLMVAYCFFTVFLLSSPYILFSDKRFGFPEGVLTGFFWERDNKKLRLSETNDALENLLSARQDSCATPKSTNEKMPNIVVLILEAVGYQDSPLNPDFEEKMPNLKKIANEGISFTNVRVSIPHTSKSIFSILSGRYPVFVRPIVEKSSNLNVPGLADILSANGYDTTYIQSALGKFESRPRLVFNMGYKNFYSAEDLGSEIWGYLASDEFKMLEPFTKHLNRKGKPQFITILTSSTHHPYYAGEEHESKSSREKFVFLLSRTDKLLGDIITVLENNGDSLLIVLGDHGEGFGKHNVKQHDNNMYEECLRSFLVFKWFDDENRQPRISDKVIGTVDIVPSILDLIGIKTNFGFDGASVFSSNSDLQNAYFFSCYYENICWGIVDNNDKYVVAVRDNRVYKFPSYRTEGDKLMEEIEYSEADNFLDKARQAIESRRPTDFQPIYPGFKHTPTDRGQWSCPENNARCVYHSFE